MSLRLAYTLIEMMVVIVVLTLIAAIAVPNLAAMVKSQRKHDYLAAVERLALQARNAAVRSGNTMVLVANENGGFSLQESDGGEEGARSVGEVQPVDELEPTRFVLRGDEVGAGDWSVRFFADGTADEASVEFTEKESTWHLSLDKRTGRARIVAGSAPDPQDDRWEAGTYVQRS